MLPDDTLRRWGAWRDLWVFGHVSLTWRPEFEAAEQRPATLYGWHRALRMPSRIHRGSADLPGGNRRGAARLWHFLDEKVERLRRWLGAMR